MEQQLGDMDAKTLKIEYLEGKIEEKYHMEGLFNQLKGDYEELRKEKLQLLDQSEQTHHRKTNEIKNLIQEKEDLIKENSRFSKMLEQRDIEVGDLQQDSRDREGLLKVASDEQENLERLVSQKQERLDMYSSEISNLNQKILDFGKLMDQLINENQRMKIRLEEFEKKEIYFQKQMKEFSKIRSDMKQKKYSELDKLAVTLQTFSAH